MMPTTEEQEHGKGSSCVFVTKGPLPFPEE